MSGKGSIKAEEQRAEYEALARPENGSERVSFGDVTEEKIDQGGPSAVDEFTYIDISSVDNKLKCITEYKTLAVEAAPSRAKQRLKSGDVLVSMTRPNLNAVAIVPPELDAAVGSTGFHVLRATEGTEPRWLYYAVQTKDFISAMSGLVQGALYPAVRPKDIRAFEIPHPPLDQQKRIVAEIEKQFSRLDEAVANLKRVKANLKRHKAAVLKAAASGRLVETEAERARREGRSYETGAQLLQRILETRRSQWQGKGKYKEPAAPDTTDLPELPVGWVWALIGEAFDVFVGATPSRAKPVYWNGGIPWVSSGEVDFCRIKQTRETISADGLENSSTYLHPAGTVLLGMIGEGKTRGQVAILDIEACNNQNSAAIRVSDTKVLPEYSYSFLEKECEDTRRRGSGGNQSALNKERVRQIPFPLPPVDEQKRIMDEINYRLSVVHETEVQVNANLKRAEGLRESLLSRAFTETSMACLRVSAVAA